MGRTILGTQRMGGRASVFLVLEVADGQQYLDAV
jgi:hypothetical protein